MLPSTLLQKTVPRSIARAKVFYFGCISLVLLVPDLWAYIYCISMRYYYFSLIVCFLSLILSFVTGLR